MNPVNVFNSPLFQIYIMGKPATEALSRPFTAANPLGDMLKGLTQEDPQAEAANATTTETVSNGDDKKSPKGSPAKKKKPIKAE